jgi:hypothetical protein
MYAVMWRAAKSKLHGNEGEVQMGYDAPDEEYEYHDQCQMLDFQVICCVTLRKLTSDITSMLVSLMSRMGFWPMPKRG